MSYDGFKGKKVQVTYKDESGKERKATGTLIETSGTSSVIIEPEPQQRPISNVVKVELYYERPYVVEGEDKYHGQGGKKSRKSRKSKKSRKTRRRHRK